MPYPNNTDPEGEVLTVSQIASETSVPVMMGALKAE